jgi:quercetin dioxygenase-like cupin family protein
MLIGHYTDVKEEMPAMPGMQATIRWLISARDGADHFAMRVIEVRQRGESIPRHRHDHEHEIFVFSGQGTALLQDETRPLTAGDFVFVPAGEVHGFVNTADEPFRFICVIPTPK